MPSRVLSSRARCALTSPFLLAAMLVGCGGSGEAPAGDSAAAAAVPAAAPTATVDTN